MPKWATVVLKIHIHICRNIHTAMKERVLCWKIHDFLVQKCCLRINRQCYHMRAASLHATLRTHTQAQHDSTISGSVMVGRKVAMWTLCLCIKHQTSGQSAKRIITNCHIMYSVRARRVERNFSSLQSVTNLQSQSEHSSRVKCKAKSSVNLDFVSC